MYYNEVFASKLQNYGKKLDIDLLGISDLSLIKNALLANKELLDPFPRAISLGIKLPDTLLNSLSYLADKKAFLNYNHYLYKVVDVKLDQASFLITKFIEANGFSAYPIPAYPTLGAQQENEIFSHKMVASLAGLGWIGKNYLVVTPEYGPRVRFASVLTDAPLKAGRPLKEQCAKCNLCIKSCPVGALSGIPFSPANATTGINVEACAKYNATNAKAWGIPISSSTCGLCMALCPYGRKYPNPRKRSSESRSAFDGRSADTNFTSKA